MPTIPTTITPKATGVVIQMESNTVNAIKMQSAGDSFGTVVLIGSAVTLYAVNDIVGMKNCRLFSETPNTYAISDESDVLFIYTTPP